MGNYIILSSVFLISVTLVDHRAWLEPAAVARMGLKSSSEPWPPHAEPAPSCTFGLLVFEEKLLYGHHDGFRPYEWREKVMAQLAKSDTTK